MVKESVSYMSDPTDGGAVVIVSSHDRKPRPEREEPAVATPVIVAPDGGYGWVVLIASFFVNVIVDGIIFSFGMLMEPLTEAFGSSASAVAWVGSMMSGFYLLAGPIVSGLCNKFGARAITIIGSFVVALGIGVSSLSETLGMMLAFYGLIGGIGFGMTYLPSIVVVGEYFEKRRALATGIAVSGSGIGGFIFAQLIAYLLHEYSWQGTILILAGISLHCAFFGALFRPLTATHRPEAADTGITRSASFMQREVLEARDARIRMLNADSVEHDAQSALLTGPLEKIAENEADEEDTRSYSKRSTGNVTGTGGDDYRRGRRPSTSSRHSATSKPFDKPDVFYSGSVQNIPEVKAYGGIQEFRRATSIPAVNAGKRRWKDLPDSAMVVVRQMLDFSLLKSPTFLLTCFCSFLTLAGFFIPFVYIKPLVQNVEGMTKEQGTLVLSAISVTNTIGRIVVGWISDFPKVDPIVVACSALIIGGIATAFAPFYNTFVILVIYALVFGLSISAFAALRSIILVDLFGIAMLNNSFGLQMLFQGLATLVGSPIAGAIKDATGSYDGAFYFGGALLAVSGALLFPAKLVQRWETRRNLAKGGKFPVLD